MIQIAWVIVFILIIVLLVFKALIGYIIIVEGLMLGAEVCFWIHKWGAHLVFGIVGGLIVFAGICFLHTTTKVGFYIVTSLMTLLWAVDMSQTVYHATRGDWIWTIFTAVVTAAIVWGFTSMRGTI